MSQAECLKILFTDKQKGGGIDGADRGGVVASVEDRKLCNGTARSFDAQHLLASTGRTLEDADMSGLDHVKSRTRFTLAENGVACRKPARHGALGQERDL